jgi:alkylhydroperoxidase/carboxymuconolactone decarboxylase family protein YurZ
MSASQNGNALRAKEPKADSQHKIPSSKQYQMIEKPQQPLVHDFRFWISRCLNLCRISSFEIADDGGDAMTTDNEFFNVKYKEGSLEPKAAQLILFAVNLAIGHEHGAKLHLGRARELGASEDEIWETVVYAMRPVAANVRNFAKAIISK